MTLVSAFISVSLYLFAALLLWARSRNKKGELSRPVIAFWAIAIFFHAINLNLLFGDNSGIDLSFFKAASLSMLLISLTLLLSCIRRPLAVLGLIVLPITIFVILLDSMNVSGNIIVRDTAAAGVQIHIISSFLAYSFLNLAGIQTIAIYMQDKRLRNSSLPGILAALPSLDAMESFLLDLLIVGILLLTASLVSGWIVHENLFAQHLVHKTTLSAIAWLLFFAVLTGRLLFGWRGRSLWKTILSGIVLLLLAYLGSKFVLELILHRA